MDEQQARATRARLASHDSWATTVDRAARTSNGRKAFEDSFLAKVDSRIIDPVQRAKAAENLRKAHFARMTYRSAQVRAARAAKKAS